MNENNVGLRILAGLVLIAAIGMFAVTRLGMKNFLEVSTASSTGPRGVPQAGPRCVAMSVPSLPREPFPHIPAYRSVTEELDAELAVEGALPADLEGVLFNNGAGRYHNASTYYEHPFDGDGRRLERLELGHAREPHRSAELAQHRAEGALRAPRPDHRAAAAPGRVADRRRDARLGAGQAVAQPIPRLPLRQVRRLFPRGPGEKSRRGR